MAKKGQSAGLDTADIQKGLSLEERRQAVLSNIAKLREQEADAIRNSSKLNDEQTGFLKNNVKELKKINDILNEIQKGQKEQIGNFKAAGDSISSMSELQEELKHHLAGAAKEGIAFAQSIDSAGAGTRDTFKKGGEFAADAITSIAEMAQLNKEDGVAIAAKAAELAYYTNGLQSQIAVLEGQYETLTTEELALLNTLEAQKDIIQEQTKEASKFANMSKEAKVLYEELNEDLEGIKKTFKKVTTTAEIFFGSTRGAMGLILFGAGELIEQFHEVGREMGFGMMQANGFKTQMLLAGILSEQSAEAIKELGRELGDVNEVSFGMAADTAMLAYNMNLSGEQAAFLGHAFGELQGKSWDTGQNMLKFTTALASANGIMPNEAMTEIANNTEFFAKFSRDGGKNIAEAAIAASKLGVGLATAEKMADHLLDYQSSVSDEMEASVLLGRNLNLGKARELAYNGDIAGAMREGLEAAGGIEEYNKMDYYQRQAVAKALGVSNAEMQKMVAHEETLKGMHGVAAQQYERISTLISTIGATVGGKVVKAMGGLVLSGAQFGAQISMIGKDKLPGMNRAFMLLAKPFDFLIGKAADLVSWIGKGIAKMVGLKAAQSSLETGSSVAGPLTKAGLPDKRFKANKTPMTAATPTAGGGGADPGEQVNKFSKINMNDVLKAAVALVILAAALWVFAKAANAFGKDINWDAVWAGIAALSVLGVAAALLSLIGPNILMGAAVMAVAAVAFYIFGMAAQQVAIGIGMFGEALSKVDVGQMALFGLALIPLGIGLATFGFLSQLIILGAGALMILGYALSLVGPGIAAIGTGIPMISQNIVGLIALIPQILQLADAFSQLAWSLMGLGIASVLAGPMLKKINLNITNSESGGKQESSSDKLLAEIVGLREDLSNGKVAVYLDGKKVNTGLNISNLRHKT